MPSRRKARECAVQMLFQWDICKDLPEQVERFYWWNYARGAQTEGAPMHTASTPPEIAAKPPRKKRSTRKKPEPPPPPIEPPPARDEEEAALRAAANEFFAGT